MIVQKKAFTLVELLVVITLLAILGTIAFITFKSKVGEARDGKRQADLTEIVNVLELYQIEESAFPNPSDAVNITYSGSAIAWKQGTFGESVAKDVKVFGQDYPVDPRYETDYTYSITARGNEFQISTIIEVNINEEGLGEEISLFPKTHAASVMTAHTLGDYNGFMVKAKDAGIEYFIATPSIIATDVSNPDVVDIISNKKLVYNNFFNLPSSYSGHLNLDGGFDFNVSDPLVFSGHSSELKSEAALLEFNEKLKYIYATTPTESFDKYISVLEKEGLTSLKGFLTRKFKITFREYFNCKDILDDGADDGDKMYSIDPDGPDGNPGYDVFCDMTTDGGGWTRVGDNHVVNGDFSGGVGVTGAVENDSTTNNIVALSTPIDGNTFALHQTGNYSSSYEMVFDDLSLLKQGYEIRMSMWRSDYGSGAIVVPGTSDTIVMGGKFSPWTLGTCTSGSRCYFDDFNRKMAYAPNFGGPGGSSLLTNLPISVKPPTNTITNAYLNGGVLFDGYVPSNSSKYKGGSWIDPYSPSEKEAINDWVLAGGILVATNNEDSWDPLGEYYGVPTAEYGDGKGVRWVVENVDHPLVNGSIGLGVDLRGQTLYGAYAHAASELTLEPDDVVLARDYYSPYAPTVILRSHGKGHIIFMSDDGMFVQMDSQNIFDPGDNETVFAAAIMAYSIETAAGVNPHEGYAFHNRLYYNDGTFSTNGQEEILETIVVDDGGTDRVWSKQRVRHRVYKTPDNFSWKLGLDANNNKDLYFTGVRLELFYR